MSMVWSFQPAMGHVNSFDEDALHRLFSSLEWTEVSFVGSTCARTNPVSTALLDYAGNPFGTYGQDEPCVHCGRPIGHPARRTITQRVATRAAFVLNGWQTSMTRPRGNWIHVRLDAQCAPVEI